MDGRVEKLVILAYDGLEATLVEEWQLRNILQEYHGRHDTLRSPVSDEILTPVIWTSFITGLPPEKHGVYDWWSYGGLIDRLRFSPLLRRIRGKRKILAFLRKLGLRIEPRKRLVDRSAIAGRRLRSIFDEYPSRVLYWPAWNEPEQIHREYAEALKRSVEDYMSVIWKWHRWRREMLMKALPEWLESNERILAAWFDISDLFGHICIARCPERLMEAYYELDSIARIVRRRVRQSGRSIAVLVVSDHGMKPDENGVGEHSEYGFWSLNVEPPLTPRSILDFRRLVEQLLG